MFMIHRLSFWNRAKCKPQVYCNILDFKTHRNTYHSPSLGKEATPVSKSPRRLLCSPGDPCLLDPANVTAPGCFAPVPKAKGQCCFLVNSFVQEASRHWQPSPLHHHFLVGFVPRDWMVVTEGADLFPVAELDLTRQTNRVEATRSLLPSWTRLLSLYLPAIPTSSYSSGDGSSAHPVLCSTHLTHWSSREFYSTWLNAFLQLYALQRDVLEQLSSWYPLLCSSVPWGQSAVISSLLSVFWCCFQAMSLRI